MPWVADGESVGSDTGSSVLGLQRVIAFGEGSHRLAQNIIPRAQM